MKEVEHMQTQVIAIPDAECFIVECSDCGPLGIITGEPIPFLTEHFETHMKETTDAVHT